MPSMTPPRTRWTTGACRGSRITGAPATGLSYSAAGFTYSPRETYGGYVGDAGRGPVQDVPPAGGVRALEGLLAGPLEGRLAHASVPPSVGASVRRRRTMSVRVV